MVISLELCRTVTLANCGAEDFHAIRLSSLITAAHNRAHPIALSYSVDDFRFIALPVLFSSIYIEQKRDYLS
jgi:hypothetical protein